MKLNLSETRERLTEAVAAVAAGQHVVILKHGTAVAAIVPAFECAMLECLSEEEWKWLQEVEKGTPRSLLPRGTLVPQKTEPGHEQGSLAD